MRTIKASSRHCANLACCQVSLVQARTDRPRQIIDANGRSHIAADVLAAPFLAGRRVIELAQRRIESRGASRAGESQV